MKNNIITLLCFFTLTTAIAQKKTATHKQPSQAEMDKMMKEAGMSAEDMKMMKEMMKEQGNSPAAKNQEATELSLVNAQFIPAKNAAKIASLKAAYTHAELIALTNTLFTKLSAKGNSKEIALVKKLITELKITNELLNAAAVAMSNGQMHTALLLALKALQMQPDNNVAQNNVAAILTQSGYPDKAMPYLVELLKKDPSNSTLLNNAAFAWLGLGDENKAYQFVYRALQQNPVHPQASSCAAIILDKKGFKQEASKLMQRAETVNFTSSMQALRDKIKTNKDTRKEMEWEKLRNKITIYEFFKPEDKKINWPEYQNIKNHKDIPNLLQIMNSEYKMREKLRKKLETLADQYAKRIEQKIGDDVSSALKMMSKSGVTNSNANIVTIAGNVLAAIMNAKLKVMEDHNNWVLKNQEKNQATYNKVRAGSKKLNAESGNEMCQRIGNKLVSQAMENNNPSILVYLNMYEEEQRNITNALLTWQLILHTASGTSADMSMQQLVSTAEQYLIDVPFAERGLHRTATNHTFYLVGCQNYEPLPDLEYEEPLLPKFDCPIVYSIPSGFSQMGNLESLSNNDFNIPQNKISQFTQNSTSYSTSGQSISEAGKVPYYTTDNSSTDISFGITYDDVVPLAPSPKNANNGNDEDVVPLAPSPKTVTGSDDDVVPLAPSKKTRDAKAAAERKVTQELLQQYSERFCKDELGQKASRKEKLKEKLNNLLKELEKEEQQELKKAEAKQKSMDEDVVPLAPTKNPEDIKKYYRDAKAAVQEAATNGGLTPSISNGLTVAGKAPGFVKGLFD